MSHATMHNTIRNRFDVSVVVPQSLTNAVQYDNTPMPSDATGENLWCRFKVIPAESSVAEFGGTTNTKRTVGFASVQIFAPVHTGTNEAHVLVDAIKTVFRGDPDSDITYGEASELNIGRSGKYWQINVSIPFRYDVQA
jgi:hypothetical protein